MLHTPRYFLPTILLHVPAFFLINVYIPLQIAYGLQAIILRHFDQVGDHALMIVLVMLFANAIYAYATWAFNRNGIYGGSYVQRKVFSSMLSKDYEFYGNTFVGSLGAQASDLRKAFTDYNRIALFDIPRTATFVICSLAILAVKSPTLAVITIACVLFIQGFNILFSKYRLQYRRQVSQATSDLAGKLGDALTHGSAVKSFAQEDYEQSRIKQPLKNWEKAQLKSWDLFTPQNSIRNIMTAITMAVLLIVSSHLYSDGKISVAIVALVQLYVIRLINVSIEVSEIIKAYEALMGEAYQPVATMLIETKVKDKPRALKLKHKPTYTITFDGVTYHYPEAKKDAQAVNNFSLDIKSGEKIGLVGFSGGGKTTATKLLLRFMDIDQGSIEIDGTDIREISQGSLRRAISYVPQEPLLFHRTILENIAYSRPEAPMKAIKAAAKTAYVDEFVKDLPKGYDSMVGERGVKLSGGQRQRVAIARALLKDAPVLVLDEATSALDSQSEQYIQKALWELMKDRTALVIAHRLSTIQRMDRIIVMDKGKIIQSGTHSSLLKDKKGAYAKLWAHQSGGYLVED